MNPQTPRQIKGKAGEELALKVLLEKGYQLINRNYRSNFGEIDLIMKDQDILVLVEVKTRKKNSLQEIEETINQKKINRILKTAEKYIEQTSITYCEIRVDAVFVETDGRGRIVRHIVDFK